MKTRKLSRLNERDFRTQPPTSNPDRPQQTISIGNDSEAVTTPTTDETKRTESDTRRGAGGSGRLTPLESLLLAAPGGERESGGVEESYDKDAGHREHLEVGHQPRLGEQTAEDSAKTIVTCEAVSIDSGGNTNANNNNDEGDDGEPDGSGPKDDPEKEGGSSSSSSSSSSDSDNEDSSSSGSSGIDNSLFEQLGEGEGEGEGEELPLQGQAVPEQGREGTATQQQEDEGRIGQCLESRDTLLSDLTKWLLVRWKSVRVRVLG